LYELPNGNPLVPGARRFRNPATSNATSNRRNPTSTRRSRTSTRRTHETLSRTRETLSRTLSRTHESSSRRISSRIPWTLPTRSRPSPADQARSVSRASL